MKKQHETRRLSAFPFASIEEEIQEIASRQAEARRTVWKVGRKALEGDSEAQADFRGAATEILLAQIFYGGELRARGLDHLGVGESADVD